MFPVDSGEGVRGILDHLLAKSHVLLLKYVTVNVLDCRRMFWNKIINNLIVVTTDIEHEPDVRSQALDGQGIIEFFRRIGEVCKTKDIPIVLASDSAPKSLGNLLLVGGPNANPVTSKVLLELDGKLRYYFVDGYDIFDKIEGKILKVEKKDNGSGSVVVVTDYGVVTCAESPYKEGCKVIICSGCYGWGTYGALEVMSRAADLRNILKEYSDKKLCQFVVKVSVRDRQMSRVSIVDGSMYAV